MTPRCRVLVSRACRSSSRGPYEMGSVQSTELLSPDDVGPAELPMWVRFTGAPDDNVVSQALLASSRTSRSSAGWAMRPHAGLSAEQSSHVKRL